MSNCFAGTKDIQTHVFVWGLNDKDQLGGPKGSKVRDSIWMKNESHLQVITYY